MKAPSSRNLVVFVLGDKPIPGVRQRESLLRVTMTSIGTTDKAILKGENPVARGVTVGRWA